MGQRAKLASFGAPGKSARIEMPLSGISKEFDRPCISQLSLLTMESREKIHLGQVQEVPIWNQGALFPESLVKVGGRKQNNASQERGKRNRKRIGSHNPL